jgi:hypothetical protein
MSVMPASCLGCIILPDPLAQAKRGDEKEKYELELLMNTHGTLS